MSVTIHARSGPIARFLRRPTLTIAGAVDARGLAAHRLLAGSIDASGLFAQRRLAYAFTFSGDDGEAYAFAGEKAFVAGNLLASFTLLAGTLRDARGDLAGDVLLRFDLRGDLGRFAKSFRAAR